MLFSLHGMQISLIFILYEKRNKMKNETKNTGAKENQTLKADYLKHLYEVRNHFYNQGAWDALTKVEADIKREESN